MKLEEIKVGDFIVYTELPYSNYANSLNMVVSVDGVLYPKPICIEWKGEYINFTDMKNAVPIEKYFDKKNWFHAIGYSQDMDAIEYMNNYWKLETKK
jgi:hypothetical protein